jgi:hypothetical protein
MEIHDEEKGIKNGIALIKIESFFVVVCFAVCVRANGVM